MHFVEQHRGCAAELGVGLDPRQEHAVGHDDHPRRLANLAVEPGRVADRLPRPFAQLASHELGGGARGETARDEQKHLSTTPLLGEQRRRDPGRLARSRRSNQQRAGAAAQRRQQVAQDLVDGQRRQCAAFVRGRPR